MTEYFVSIKNNVFINSANIYPTPILFQGLYYGIILDDTENVKYRLQKNHANVTNLQYDLKYYM